MTNTYIGIVEGQVYNRGQVLNKYSHYWEPKTWTYNNQQVSLFGNYFIELDNEIYYINSGLDSRYGIFKLEKKSKRQIKLKPTPLPKI